MADKKSVIQEIKDSIKMPGNIAKRTQMPSVTTAEVNQGSLFSLLAYIMGGSKAKANDEKAAMSNIKKPLPVLFDTISKTVDNLTKRIENDAKTVQEFNLSSKTLGQLNSLADLPYKDFMTENVAQINSDVNTYLSAIPFILRNIFETIDHSQQDIANFVFDIKQGLPEYFKKLEEKLQQSAPAESTPKGEKTVGESQLTLFVSQDSLDNLQKLADLMSSQSDDKAKNIKDILNSLYESLNEFSEYDIKPVDNKIQELDSLFTTIEHIPELHINKFTVPEEELKTLSEGLNKVIDSLYSIKISAGIEIAPKLQDLFDELVSIKWLFMNTFMSNVEKAFGDSKALNTRISNTNESIKTLQGLIVLNPNELEPIVKNFHDSINLLRENDINKDLIDLINLVYKFELFNDTKVDTENIKQSLYNIGDLISKHIGAFIAGLNKFNKAGKLDVDDAYVKLDDLVTLIEPLKRLEGLKEIDPKVIDSAMSAINKNLDNINDFLKNIIDKIDTVIVADATDRFEKLNEFLTVEIPKVAESAKQSKQGLDTIDMAFADISETLENAESSMQANSLTNINVSLEGLGKTIMLMGATMLIGGWIINNNPDLIKASLKFGLVMSAFLLSVLIPVGIMTKLTADSDNANEVIKETTNMIVKMSLVMLLAGFIMELGGKKLEKNCALFASTLTKFLLKLTVPLGIIAILSSFAENGVITEFTSLIMKLSVVMMIGSLFMMLGGGKFAENALAFGTTLMKFTALVLIPFLLMGALCKRAFVVSKELGSLVTSLAVIMSIGALFMMLGGGKFMKAAIQFGLALGVFVFLTLAPFMLFSKFMNPKTLESIHVLKSIILTASITLMVGALFIMLSGGKFAMAAMAYTALFTLYMIGIAIPIIAFSKLKKQLVTGLTSLVALLIVSTAALMIGAMLVTSGLVWDALLGAGVIALYMTAMMFIVKLLGSQKKSVIEGTAVMFNLAIFMVAASLSMSILAFAIDKFGADTILLSAGILTGFIGLAIGGLVLLNRGSKYIYGGIDEAIALSIVIGALTVSITILSFLKTEGLLEKVAILALVIAGMTLLCFALSYATAYIIPGAIAATLMGGALMTLSVSLIILGLLPTKGLLEKILVVGVIVAALSVLFFGIGFLSVPIAFGSVAIGMLSISLMLFSGALAIINLIDPAAVLSKLPALMIVTAALSLLFFGIGFLAVPIAFGSVAIVALSLSLMILTAAFAVFLSIDTETLTTQAMNLIKTLGVLALAYTALTLMIPIILLGTLGGTLLSASLVVLTGALLLFSIPDYNKIEGHLDSLNGKILPGISNMLTQITKMIPKIVISRIFVPMLVGVMRNIAKMNTYLLQSANIPGSPDENKDKIVATAKIGADAFDSIYERFNKIKKIHIWKVKGKVRDISDIISYAIKPIQKLAVTEIPVAYDKDGNVTQTIKLDYNQAALAGMNMVSIITFLAGSLGSLYTGVPYISYIGGKPVIVNAAGACLEKMFNDDDIIENMVTFIKGTGEGISAMAEALANYAKLQVPEEWDSNGKPIAFRQLSDAEIQMAGVNIGTIVTDMANTIAGLLTIKLANGDTFEDVLDDDSLMAGIMNFVMGIGDGISAIAKGIADYAELRIPDEFDAKGNPISYMKLEPAVFSMAATNIKMILSTLGNTLISWAEEHEDLFDTGGGFLESEHPSKAEEAIKFAIGLGNTVSSFASGLEKMSKLAFPIYDENGEITGYKNMNKGDIQQAANNIKTVMTTSADAVLEAYYSNWLLGSNSGKTVIENLNNVGKLVATFAEAINTYAKGGIPDQWNKDGKPIHFRQITPVDIMMMNWNIRKLMTATAESIGMVYYTDWKDGHGSKVNSLFDDKDGKAPMKKALDAMKNLGGFVKDISDGIIKLASGQIAIAWDKDGKAIKFRQFDIADGAKVAVTMQMMIECLFDAMRTVWDSHSKLFVDDGKGGFFAKDDTPIAKMTKAMSSMTTPVATIVDIIKNITELKIPAAGATIDKEGKASKYVNLFDGGWKELRKLRWQIQDILTQLMGALFHGITDAYNFNQSTIDGFADVYAKLNPAISKASTLITNLCKMLENYSKLNIAEYDKEGKVKNVVKISAKILGVESDGTVKNPKVGTVAGNLKALVTLIPASINLAMNDPSVKEMVDDPNYVNKLDRITRVTVSMYRYAMDVKPLVNVLSRYSVIQLLRAAVIIKTIDKIFKDKNPLSHSATKNLNAFNIEFEQLIDSLPKFRFVVVKDYMPFYMNVIKQLEGISIFTYRLFHERFKKTGDTLFEMLDNIEFRKFNRLANKLRRLSNHSTELIKSLSRFYMHMIKFSVISQNPDDIKIDFDPIKQRLLEFNRFIEQITETDMQSSFSINKLLNKQQLKLERLESYINEINKTRDILNMMSISNPFSIANIRIIDKVKIEELNASVDDFNIILSKIESKENEEFNNIYYKKAINTITDFSVVLYSIDTKTVKKNIEQLKESFGIFNRFIKEETPDSDQQNRFKQEVESIKQLSDTFNNIDMSKVETVKKLVDSMEKLGSRFGDMDKFASAVADKLVEALYSISAETAKAGKIIADADKNQKKRQAEITANIKNMKGVVNKSLEVTIKKDENGDTHAIPGGDEGDDNNNTPNKEKDKKSK